MKKNKLPIIVGGTGLYMKSLLFPYSFNGAFKNEELREYYKKLCEDKGNEYVYNILKEKSPERAEKLHFNDTKRVIRSLEMLEVNKEIIKDKEIANFDYELIVLTCERSKLYDRINKRVDEMFEEGLFEEFKSVVEKYNLTRENQSMQAIGYREFFDYIDGLKTMEEVKEKIKQDSRHYAKRQITWFKTMPNAKFFNIENIDEILKYLKESL